MTRRYIEDSSYESLHPRRVEKKRQNGFLRKKGEDRRSPTVGQHRRREWRQTVSNRKW